MMPVKVTRLSMPRRWACCSRSARAGPSPTTSKWRRDSGGSWAIMSITLSRPCQSHEAGEAEHQAAFQAEGALGGFDVALQPAVVAYASPLKLFEYLALGKAIVAPDQPNIKEILTDEHNAVLFDPKQSGGLADATGRLCADDLLRTKVAANARRAIGEQKLTWKANAQRVVELFGTLRTHA
ncbi:MAG: glycosyltransferase [Oxalobacteraceae bacterium]|nr:MAG: glycosyltransferase [Oxalobacteraceae bacterium]